MLYNCPSSLVRFVSVVCSSLKQSVGDYAHVEIFTFTSAFFICHIEVLMMHKVSISLYYVWCLLKGWLICERRISTHVLWYFVDLLFTLNKIRKSLYRGGKRMKNCRDKHTHSTTQFIILTTRWWKPFTFALIHFWRKYFVAVIIIDWFSYLNSYLYIL